MGSLDRLCRAIAGWCRAKGAYSSADPSGRGLSGVRRKTFRSPSAAMGGFTRLLLLIQPQALTAVIQGLIFIPILYFGGCLLQL